MAAAVPKLREHASHAEYRRHRPEETVLYGVVCAHWPSFREHAENAGGLPKFVVREIEEYLRCGLLEYGCVRVACTICGFERLVGFSCKRRGFCPSCLGRRMSDTALLLVERVLPEVPIRQWVCSLPWALRVRLGYDRELCSDVLSAFATELCASLRRRAKRELGLASVEEAHPGAVTVVQRTDSALRLNVHFHTLALDGVYVRASGDDVDAPLVFRALGAPTAGEVLEVAERTAARVEKLLAKRDDEERAAVGEHDALTACYGAAASGRSLFGERAGKPSLRIVAPSRTREDEPVAEVRGFNVHAKVAVDGRDRKRLERLCRYLVRPPLALERLEERRDGLVSYTMKKPWRDGTIAWVFEPLDLIARLCAMVPPPRFHLVRYHGVLSSHAGLRRDVVPKPPPSPRGLPDFGDEGRAQLTLPLFAELASDEPPNPAARKPWAWLLRHVFAVDVTTCPKCEGRMRWLEAATAPEAIARLLAAHGLGPAPPRRTRPPRGQLALRFGV